ncbi:hypothetical protein EVAR_69221_1, partial [Eumeta japonica]
MAEQITMQLSVGGGKAYKATF